MASVAFVVVAQTMTATASLAVQIAVVVIASVAGAYIDNQIFGPDKDNTENNLEIAIQQIGSEGGPASYCLGPEAVTLGQLIWMDSANFVGKAPNQTTSVAVAICRNQILKVERVFSGNIDLWINDGAFDFDTTGLRFAANSPGGGRPSGAHYHGAWIRNAAGTGHFDLTNLVTGRKNAISFGANNKKFDNRGNNWNHDPKFRKEAFGPPYKWGEVVLTKRDSNYTYALIRRILYYARTNYQIPKTTYHQFPTSALPVQEDSTTTKVVNVYQNFSRLNTNYLDELTFYNGSEGAVVDPWITAREPAGVDLQAFEGIAYIVLKKMKVEDFGRRVPTDMTMVVSDREDPPYMKAAITTVLGDWHDWDNNSDLDYDVTRLEDRTGRWVRGYTARGNISANKRLEPIRVANDVVGEVSRNGVLTFRYYDDAEIFYVESASFLEPLAWTQVPAASMPTTVTCKFRDSEAFRYEEGSVDEHINFLEVGSRNETVLDLRMVTMTRGEAREVARRHLWRPWLQRDKCRGRLSARFNWLHEGNAIATEVNGDAVDIMLTKVEIGANWEIEFEGYRFHGYPLDSAGPYFSN